MGEAGDGGRPNALKELVGELGAGVLGVAWRSAVP
jgi:hypothetical protein